MSERRLVPTFSPDEEEMDTEETLKDEEDTSTATGEAEENEADLEEDTFINESDDELSTDEESVEDLKARLAKAESDRDNYKQGLLSAKGKNRAEKGLKIKPNVEVKDVNERAVLAVLAKKTENEALLNTITPKHKDYIPELVSQEQYNEIIGFLPRNVDPTSYDSIIRGLKLATDMWKKERGIQDKSPKKDTGLQNSKSSVSSSSSLKEEKTIGRFKNPATNYLNWYNNK